MPINRTPKGGKKQEASGKKVSTLEKDQTVEKAEKFFKSLADTKRKRHSAQKQSIKPYRNSPTERPLGCQIPYDSALPLRVKELGPREHNHLAQGHADDPQLTPYDSV